MTSLLGKAAGVALLLAVGACASPTDPYVDWLKNETAINKCQSGKLNSTPKSPKVSDNARLIYRVAQECGAPPERLAYATNLILAAEDLEAGRISNAQYDAYRNEQMVLLNQRSNDRQAAMQRAYSH